MEEDEKKALAASELSLHTLASIIRHRIMTDIIAEQKGLVFDYAVLVGTRNYSRCMGGYALEFQFHHNPPHQLEAHIQNAAKAFKGYLNWCDPPRTRFNLFVQVYNDNKLKIHYFDVYLKAV